MPQPKLHRHCFPRPYPSPTQGHVERVTWCSQRRLAHSCLWSTRRRTLNSLFTRPVRQVNLQRAQWSRCLASQDPQLHRRLPELWQYIRRHYEKSTTCHRPYGPNPIVLRSPVPHLVLHLWPHRYKQLGHHCRLHHPNHLFHTIKILSAFTMMTSRLWRPSTQRNEWNLLASCSCLRPSSLTHACRYPLAPYTPTRWVETCFALSSR